MTTETFIEKAKKIHGDKYDYSKTVYNDSHSNVCIDCKIHGGFYITATNHLSGRGCQKCSLEENKKKQSKTREKFIEDAIKVHGNRYDYSKVEYTNSKTKVCIIDPVYGEFWMTPDKHLSGYGYNNPYERAKHMFIEQCKEKYGDKYDYSKVDYKNKKTDVRIICKEHGEFLVSPTDFLNGHDCPICNKIENKTKCISLKVSKQKSELYDFIRKAKKVHGNKYDYSNVTYINNRTSVSIICPIHGMFMQTPNNHLMGRGCYKCSGKGLTIKERIEQYRKIHGDKYDYSKVNYVNAITPIEIICKKHGSFFITPNKHLSGRGCHYCTKSIMENSLRDALLSNGIEFEQQKTFEWLKMIGHQFLDFYIPSFNIGIECQGMQHIENNGYLFGSNNPEETFNDILKKDTNKNALCRENGITLLYLIDNKAINKPLFEDERLKYIYNCGNAFYSIEDLLIYIKNLIGSKNSR